VRRVGLKAERISATNARRWYLVISYVPSGGGYDVHRVFLNDFCFPFIRTPVGIYKLIVSSAHELNADAM